ncbi:MAG: FprA family A-type flavoprotein [Methanothrix sp.]|nr:FprA family A-type flavoprotein [Methanothrix sp.]
MPKIAIIYASGTGKTKKMAEAIASGAKSVPDVEVLLKTAFLAKPDEVSNADALILGGSTYNNKLIKAMEPFLDGLDGLDLKGRAGAAFGSYGWSGEGVPILIERMKSWGMSVTEPGTTAVQMPSKEVLDRCFELGKSIATGLKNQPSAI